MEDNVILPRIVHNIADEFHLLLYHLGDRPPCATTTWMGTRVGRSPLDLWIYQELVHELKPDLIVDVGTGEGGCARYFASLCDFVGHGAVVSVDDKSRGALPAHPRIHYVNGPIADKKTAAEVAAQAQGKARVMVLIAGGGKEERVRAKLDAYAPFVTVGSYLIIEGTNVNGNPVDPTHGPGAMEALQVFMGQNPQFMIDPTREKFFVTFNPLGYLKRVS